jgi:hypothetical protein
MERHFDQTSADNGTIDHEYTWGRPLATYVTPVQYLRLLAMKGRLEASGELYTLRERVNPGRPETHRVP